MTPRINHLRKNASRLKYFSSEQTDSTSNLITKNQSGFRTGDSMTNQLLGFINEIHKSFENRQEVRSVFLDISKAFDKV